VNDLSSRIWEWLPGRTDCRRVTLPATIAAALGVPMRNVSVALAEMEQHGYVVRDSATGARSGWHRGTPPPGAAKEPAPAPMPSLFDLPGEAP
jgi:hypothetical protein